MNPLGVLCARDVIDPASTGDTPSHSVDADMDIRELMAYFDESFTRVSVVENGEVLGEVPQDSILHTLVAERSERTV